MRETPDAALAFERYYSLGEDRTLALLAKQMHQETTARRNQEPTKRLPTEASILSQLKKWSTEHGWQSRIIERDKVEAERQRRKQAKAVEQMNERHALIGTTQQAKAIKQIEALIEAKSFGSMAAVQLLKLATDLERVARGASTEQVAITGKDGGPVEVHGAVGFYGVELPQKRNDAIERSVQPILPVKNEMEGGDANAYSDSGSD